MTTTTAPGIRYRKTKTGTWVAFGPAAVITAGATITVTTRAGVVHAEHVVSVGRPFAADGAQMVYGYLADRDTTAGAENTTGGLCENCGSTSPYLTLCRDASGLKGYCCASCATGPSVERSFG